MPYCHLLPLTESHQWEKHTVHYDFRSDDWKQWVDYIARSSYLLQQGRFVTKCRHVFHKDEMDEDLVFVDAAFADRTDDVEYIEILPTSPP